MLTSRDTSLQGSIVRVADFAPRQAGGFLAAQLAIGRAARERLGLGTVFVLPERARRRGGEWLTKITDAGIQLEFLPEEAWRRPRALLAIARSADARIVHSHFTWFDVESLYAGRRAGCAVLWHVHNGLLGYPVGQRLRDVVKARILARGCDAVVAVSDHVARDLRRRGFPMHKVIVLQNALELERFRNPLLHRDETRKRLGVDERALMIVSFAWPPTRKGADVLVDGIVRFATNARTPVAAVLAGETAQLGAFLRRRTAHLPHWLSIVPPVENVADLFGAADVFVSAAREEGFSYAVAEAIACGLPVVGSDIPGTSHFWRAPCFVRYPVEDPEALAERLQEVSAGGGRELGAANRDWAFEHLRMDRLVDETIECYRRLLIEHPS
jgi:glycosyltransferase involved in cell wall biosynthesis